MREPTLRAGFDELVREWLRLAEQAEWIATQQLPPLTKEPRAGIDPRVERASTVPLSTGNIFTQARVTERLGMCRKRDAAIA